MTQTNRATPGADAGFTTAPNEPRQTETTNGQSAATTEGNATAASPSAATPSSLERADVLTDRFVLQVAAVTAALGRGLLRFTARVREEAEDVWAEAQHIRRGDKS